MDYMFGYSNYSPDKFKDKKYLELINSMASITFDEENREKIISIMKEGGYDNYSVNNAASLMNNNNPLIEARKRVGVAYLIARNPETYDYITKNNVCVFHGTNSHALPGILKNGLKSFGVLKKENVELKSGEQVTMEYRLGENSSDFISVSDDLETIYEYSAYDKDKSGFGVAIGLKQEALKKLKTVHVDSDCVEFGIKGQVPVDMIDFIGVAQDNVDYVKKLVGQRNIKVMPMPLNFEEKFYLIEGEGLIEIYNNRLDNLRKQVLHTRRKFGIESYRDLGKKIGMDKMLDTLKNLLALKKKENNKKTGMEIGDE